MDKEIQASQIYSRVLYSRRRGCALWVPEPNNDLPPAYLETGVQIGDVGILRADGRFSFIFNACCPASDPVNRYGVPDDFQPLIWDNSNIRDNTELDGFQQVAGKWDGPRDIIPNYFRPGEPVMSRGAEKQALGAEASVSVPGVPVGVGTGFSITFAKHQGAVILPPNGVISVDCEGQRLFREYAEKNYDSWYRFLHERRGMEVEDGSIYFLTGFDKTDCWEIAVFSNNLKERMCEIIINTGGLAGGDGRLKFSDSSHLETFSSRCSPSNNANLNQALFIRGFRISRPRKLRSLFSGLGVELTSTYDSSWKDILGKKGSYFPYSRGGPSSSGAGSSRSTGSSSLGAAPSNTFSDMMDDGSSPDSSCAGTTSSDEDGLTPPSELYHPSKVINDYILQSTPGIETVITHDEDWISLLNDEDIELPDDTTLIQRLLDRCHITVRDGCALIDHFVENRSHPQQLIIIEESDNSSNQDIKTAHGVGEGEKLDAISPRSPELDYAAVELLRASLLPEKTSTESRPMNMYDSHDHGTSNSGYTLPNFATNQNQNSFPTSCHLEALRVSPLPDIPYDYNPLMHSNSAMYDQASHHSYIASPPPSGIPPPTPTYPVAASTSYVPAHGHQVDSQQNKQNIANLRSSRTSSGGLKRSSPHVLVEPPMKTRRRLSVSTNKDVYPYHLRRRPTGDFSDDDEEELTELPPNASDQQKIEHQRYRNALAARRSRKRKELYQQELEQRVEQLTMEVEKWRTRGEMLRRIVEGQGMNVPDWSDEGVEPEGDSVRRDEERTIGPLPPVPRQAPSSPLSQSPILPSDDAGLLSQLMNPDPEIFPADHPYRLRYSSGDVGMPKVVTRLGVVPSEEQQQQTQHLQPRQKEVKKSGISSTAPRAPAPAKTSTPNGVGRPMALGLQMSKSSVALPVVDVVTAARVEDGGLVISRPCKKDQTTATFNTTAVSGGGYRPKGQPQELEDDTDTEGDGHQMEISGVAQHKLPLLTGKRDAVKQPQTKQKNGSTPIRPDISARTVADTSILANPSPMQIQRAQPQHVPGAEAATTAPLPIKYPYNLPPAAPPLTPRTTRQLMLRKDMSESVRDNLFWSRQLSRAEMSGPRRRSPNDTVVSQGDAGIVDDTPPPSVSAVPNLVQLSAEKKPGRGILVDAPGIGEPVYRTAARAIDRPMQEDEVGLS